MSNTGKTPKFGSPAWRKKYLGKNKRRRNSATDHPDTSPSYHPKGGTSTEVRSPTSTKTEVRSPTETSTSTSTDAYTAGNVTVTGGAGANANTTVRVFQRKLPESSKGSERPQRAPWDGVPQVHAAGPQKSSNTASKKAYAAIKKFLSKMNPGRKKNPASEAEAMYELFHGMPSEEIIEIVERVHVHSKLWTAGTLTMMKVETESGYTFDLIAPDPDTAKKDQVVYMTLNKKGNQIFFRGGDQEIPKSILEKAKFKEDDFREHMVIGWVTELTYRTRKSFEKDGKEQVDFYHPLGKQGSKGYLPLLVYKPRDPSMELFGGRYKVAPRRGDIDASPGIVG